MWIHYTLFTIYFLLLSMAIWSFIVASCSDPGYIPHDYTKYDVTLLNKREQILMKYLNRIGQGDSTTQNTVS